MLNEQPLFSLNELAAVNQTIYDFYASRELSLHDFIQVFLEKIRLQLFCDKVNLVFIDHNTEKQLYEVSTFHPLGWDERNIDVYIRKYFEIDDVIPILMQREHIAFRNNDLFSVQERMKTRYYQEFVEPADIQISIDANIVLPNNPNIGLILGFFRDFGKREFSRKELELIKVYQPHLANIFTDYFKTDGFSLPELFSIMDIMDSIGICALDEGLNIQINNSALQHFIEIEESDGKAIGESRLIKQIQHYCNLLIKSPDKKKIGPFDYSSTQNNYLIEVSLLAEPENNRRFLATVYSSSKFFIQRFSSLKDNYTLTPREYEIILLMTGKGMSTKQIAEALFISTSTVKKHISSAYKKMGINTQKQLLSLLNLI